MNKGIKYILGYATIFLLAMTCTFGIINYSKLKNKTPENNSQNLGSVDGKKTDKETTIIIEKLSTLNDIDSLNSELKLSDSVLKILKKYEPTVSYAVDNSEDQEKVLIRQGGYYDEKERINVGANDIIGAYKVKDGKLESTNEDLQLLGTKYSGDDKLKWNVMNINNTEHDKEIARSIASNYIDILSKSPEFDPIFLLYYFSDKKANIVPGKGMRVYVPFLQANVVDIYNSGLKDTLSLEQVHKKMSSIKNFEYKEIDDSFKGNEKKYTEGLKSGVLLYFKKDKIYVGSIEGHAPYSILEPSKSDKWKIEGDKITIPIVPFGGGSEQKGTIVLRLNNKKYEGGQSRTKYYVESLDLKE